MCSNFSHEMYKFTEKVGEMLPLDAHKIIKHRYQIATELSKKKVALEVGVGQGYGLNSIAKNASKYVGLEYIIENINKLNQRTNLVLEYFMLMLMICHSMILSSKLLMH